CFGEVARIFLPLPDPASGAGRGIARSAPVVAQNSPDAGPGVVSYGRRMAEPPVENSHAMLYFSDGSLAYAGHYLHEGLHPVHTHSFVEVAVMTGGAGVHLSL